MLSYQHGYHAGNFADVHKHCILAVLISALNQKNKPWSYLETHAGSAFYNLQAEQAQKTFEYETGIGRLWALDAAPAAIAPYLVCVRSVNSRDGAGELISYPGSPTLAADLAREDDRLSLMELHPAEYQRLRRYFSGEKQVAVHHRDGYEGVYSLLPPKPNRGLVLIDPSYEVKSEYDQVVEQVRKFVARWPNGCFAIWYPILAAENHLRMLSRFEALGLRKLFVSQLWVKPEPCERMCGSGMLLINPPWQSDQAIGEVCEFLFKQLADKGARPPQNLWRVPE